MELHIVTFNSFLISHAQRDTAQGFIEILKADIYCISETHLKNRHSVQFTGSNIIRKGNNTGAAILVRKREQSLKVLGNFQLKYKYLISCDYFNHRHTSWVDTAVKIGKPYSNGSNTQSTSTSLHRQDPVINPSWTTSEISSDIL